MGVDVHIDMIDKVIKLFLQSQPHDYESVLNSAIKGSDNQTCLHAACIAGKAEFLHLLINDYQVNPSLSWIEDSNRNKSVKTNLLDETLRALIHNKPIEMDGNVYKPTPDEYFEVLKYLAVHKAQPDMNDDPLEGPILLAHFLAHPELSRDVRYPHFDMVADVFGEQMPEKFDAPYDFFKKKFPEAIKKFEIALEVEINSPSAKTSCGDDYP